MKSKTEEEIQEAIDLQNGYCTLGFWSRNGVGANPES